MDHQQLLAEYAVNGSETAFREVVSRYLNFVYSTALRSVGGDTHLAEDVAQTVFIDVARKAGMLSGERMLGGWLHRHTCFVAAKLMRSERRRQFREKQAAQMNAMNDHSEANLARVRPVLADAINRLAPADRAAILLRFFEQRDLRSIGEILGSNEDAAQKRVARALEKLRSLLSERGVAFSSAGLATLLAAEAVSAAPGSLEALVAGTVASSAPTGSALTLFNIMASTKLKLGAGALVVAGLTTSLIIHYQTAARLRDQDRSFRQQTDAATQLSADNARLAGLLQAAQRAANNPATDLAKLRAEADTLRRQTNELVALRRQNQELKSASASATTPLQTREETLSRIQFEKNWMLAFRIYADKNGRFPENFDEASAFWPKNIQPESNLTTDQFEILYSGPLAAIDSSNVSDTIVIREREPRLNTNGKWTRVYAMADGSVQTIGMPFTWIKSNGEKILYDTFESFERDRILSRSEP